MAELVGNLLVAQSGGATAVMNASVAGIIQQAGRHEEIEEIFGGLHGIYGILSEDLIDLNDEKAKAIEGLKYTPGAALGTSRYKIDAKKKPDQAAQDMARLFEVFAAHNIRFFFYVGGNESQETASKIHEEALRRSYDLRVIGVPKTIDNDLPHTDHCPGYGSVVKYAATTVMEIALDVGSMAAAEGSCCIIEVMGGKAGWIAAGTALARRAAHDAPHIILLPEVPFDEAGFLKQVKQVVDAHRCCIVVAGEGLKGPSAEPQSADTSRLDAFGHPVFSGAAERLEEIVQKKLGVKTRSVKLGYAQRAAVHLASANDIAEAAACGEAAVRAALDAKSGYMVKIVRVQSHPYKWTTDLQPLGDIANVERLVPREWISEDGFMPNEKFIEYARPLIEGEVKIPMDGGLPRYVTLEKSRLEKKLPPRS